MPTYCYRDEKGQLVELVMTVAEMLAKQRGGDTIEEAGQTMTRDMASELLGRSATQWNMHCEALAVFPEDIPKFKEYDREHGCPVEYDHEGCPVLTSRKQYADYCRAHGYHNRDAGYGDAAPR